jgi:hypothetical protein
MSPSASAHRSTECWSSAESCEAATRRQILPVSARAIHCRDVRFVPVASGGLRVERVQAPVSSITPEQVVPSLAPFEPSNARSLEELAVVGRSTPGQEGRAAVTSLHEALGTLQPTEANGELLLRLLDDGAFNELRADDGSSTRELAVETLIRLGYPWALRIHPDELAWYRRTQNSSRQLKIMILLGVLAMAGTAAGFLYGLF